MASVAVITPYHREPLELLAQCHRSVLQQQAGADHFLVADGEPNPEVDRWDARHVVLPASHGYGGAVPRGIGALLAEAQGYDFIAFLDADNWYHPQHLASLLELHQRTGAPVCTSFRTFHRPDGTPLATHEPDEERLELVDTSCFLLHRAAFDALAVWVRLPPELFAICDRVFLAALRHRRHAIQSTRLATVAYRTLHQTHYERAGIALPQGFKPAGLLRPSYDWLVSRQGVAQCVERLGFWPPAFMPG